MTGLARAIFRPGSVRRWITVLTLLTFVLQSLALQTHIHQLQPPAAKTVHVTTDGGSKAPLKLDPVDQCRLCQELVHAGTFLTPSVATTIALLTFVLASFVTLLVLASDPATAFAWQSRAPPVR